jgi:multiple sugar transport system ATP-binding protein
MNFLNGKLGEDHIMVDEVKIAVPEGKMKPLREQNYVGKDVILGVRPEDMHDEPLFIDANQDKKIKANIEVAELMGSESYLYSRMGEQEFIARVDSRSEIKGGDEIDLAIDMNKVHFFDKDTEERIR